jgi:hypothetical protein
MGCASGKSHVCLFAYMHMLENGVGSAALLAIHRALTHKLMRVWKSVDALVYLIAYMHTWLSFLEIMCLFAYMHMLKNGVGSAALLAIHRAQTHKLKHVWNTIDTLVYEKNTDE